MSLGHSFRLHTADTLRENVEKSRLTDEQKDILRLEEMICTQFGANLDKSSEAGLYYCTLPIFTRDAIGLGPNRLPYATNELLARVRGKVVEVLINNGIAVGVAGLPDITPSKHGTINGKPVPLVLYWGTPCVPQSVHSKFERNEVKGFLLRN